MDDPLAPSEAAPPNDPVGPGEHAASSRSLRPRQLEALEAAHAADAAALTLSQVTDLTGGSMAATMGTTTYAGFWRRFAAWILVGLLLSLVTVPFTLQFGGDAAAEAARTSAAGTISTVIGWLYFALMESSAKQATGGQDGTRHHRDRPGRPEDRLRARNGPLLRQDPLCPDPRDRVPDGGLHRPEAGTP